MNRVAGMLPVRIPQSNQSALVIIFYLFFGAAAVVNAIPIIFQPDAYYVFTVSRNLATGGGLTFDGVSVTTGFHPLWLGVTTATYFLTRDIPTFQYSVFVIQTALFLSGHALLLRVALRAGISIQSFLLVSIPVFIVHLNIFQEGLENTLLFFFLSLFLWLHTRDWSRRLTFAIIAATVLILIYFSRLDGAFLLALYLPWHFVREWRGGNISSAVTLPAVVTAAVLLHWVIMFAAFGTIFSTSQIAINDYLSKIADTEGIISWAHHPVTQRLQDIVVAVNLWPEAILRQLGAVIPAGLLLAIYLVAKKDAVQRMPLILVGLMALLQLTYYILVFDGFMQPWYFTGWYITVGFGGAFLLSNILRKLSIPLTIFVVVAGMIAFLSVDTARSHLGWTYFASRSEILQEYQSEDNVLVGYSPDVVGFYGGVPIRHLQGLVNGYDFLNTYLIPRNLASYMADIDATHFVGSNSRYIPTYVPCVAELARDKDGPLVAYGIYDQHNSYVAIYRVMVTSVETPELAAGLDRECGPVIGSNTPGEG